MPHASSSLFPRLLLLVVAALALAACDQLGIETPAQTVARQEAEGKAIGGACRQSGRALEDCYRASPKTSKAAIYAGWRDMDAYMRDNKIDIVLTEDERAALREQRAAETAASAPAAAPMANEGPTDKPDEKAAAKPAGKTGK